MRSADIPTFKVKLPSPQEINGEKIETLSFREPTGADMERFLGEMVGDDGVHVGKSVTALAAATIMSHPLSEDDIRALSAKNYMAIATEFMRFLS